MTGQKEKPQIIPPYGGYRDGQSYQRAEIVKGLKGDLF